MSYKLFYVRTSFTRYGFLKSAQHIVWDFFFLLLKVVLSINQVWKSLVYKVVLAWNLVEAKLQHSRFNLEKIYITGKTF